MHFIIFIISTSFLIAISVSLYQLFIKYQQKKIENELRINQIRIEYDKTILNTKLEIQEEVFNNLSKEIHDNIGQKLSLVKLKLSTLKHASEVFHSEGVIDLLGEIIIDLKKLSIGMDSNWICENGLIQALEKIAQQLRTTNLFDVELLISFNNLHFSPEKELILFRIVQEAVNNIIKHSSATKVKISVEILSDIFHMQISDNGNGFDQNNLQKYLNGAGLRNMKIRAKAVHGDFHIKSEQGLGTTVYIKIPLKHEQQN